MHVENDSIFSSGKSDGRAIINSPGGLLGLFADAVATPLSAARINLNVLGDTPS